MKKKWITLLILIALITSYLPIRLRWETKYNYNNFNCVDMSNTLAPIFHNLGFNTSIIYGYNDHAAHAWLSINGIYFDAVSLSISPEDKYKVYFTDPYPYKFTNETIQRR